MHKCLRIQGGIYTHIYICVYIEDGNLPPASYLSFSLEASRVYCNVINHFGDAAESKSRAERARQRGAERSSSFYRKP